MKYKKIILIGKQYLKDINIILKRYKKFFYDNSNNKEKSDVIYCLKVLKEVRTILEKADDY